MVDSTNQHIITFDKVQKEIIKFLPGLYGLHY